MGDDTFNRKLSPKFSMQSINQTTDPTVIRKERQRKQKMMTEGVLRKKLMNISRIEDKNKENKVRSRKS